MKILALESGFPPELASGRLSYELSREFVKRGHKVVVATVFPRKYLITPNLRKRRSKFFHFEKMEGINVLRVQPEFSFTALWARAVEYITLPVLLFLGGLLAGRSDIILCSSNPFIALAGCLLSKIKRAPVVSRLQDIHPDALVRMGLLKNPLLIKILELFEHFSYRCVDHMTVISEGCRSHVLSKGIRREKVDLIPNWADTGKINPSTELDNFRRSYKLSDKFVVTYAGIMSWPQDLETLVDSASLLRDYKDIQFFLVGQGEQKKLLEEKIKKLRLENVKLLPLQPRETYFEILQSSDVCLVSLKKSYSSPTIPSKMLDIMMCSKPIIANVPYESDVHRVIEQGRCGIWTEPGNPDAFKQVVLTLYKNQKLREELGKRGREYVERHLSLKACADQYEALIEKVLQKARTKRV